MVFWKWWFRFITNAEKIFSLLEDCMLYKPRFHFQFLSTPQRSRKTVSQYEVGRQAVDFHIFWIKMDALLKWSLKFLKNVLPWQSMSLLCFIPRWLRFFFLIFMVEFQADVIAGGSKMYSVIIHYHIYSICNIIYTNAVSVAILLLCLTYYVLTFQS